MELFPSLDVCTIFTNQGRAVHPNHQNLCDHKEGNYNDIRYRNDNCIIIKDAYYKGYDIRDSNTYGYFDGKDVIKFK